MKYMKRIPLFLFIFVSIFIYGCQTNHLVPGEGYIDVDGGKVWYKIVGSGSKTPLLVIHGISVQSSYLKPLEALAEDRPVIFYDQLTCGKSATQNDTLLWTITRFVDEIKSIRKALGLNEIHIYAHSWGTILSAEYMFTKPDGVKSLILSGPVFDIPREYEDINYLISTLPDSIHRHIIENEKSGNWDSPEYQSAKMIYYSTFFTRKQPWSEELVHTFQTVNIEMYNYFIGPAIHSCSGFLCDYSCIDRLGEISIPTLLIAGEYDTSRPSTAKEYQKLIPNSELLVLDDCGHLTTQDKPEKQVKEINKFLSQLEKE